MENYVSQTILSQRYVQDHINFGMAISVHVFLDTLEQKIYV